MADRFPLIIDNSEEKIKELVSGDNLDLTKSNLKNADYIQSAGVNVAGVATATSLIGDGSQLTNLPPSGGSLTATTSGTLADGDPVIVNTDGTVSGIVTSLGPDASWIVTFGGTGTDFAAGLDVDSSGNAYIVGTRGNVGGSEGEEWFIAKYNSGGVIQWQRTLGGSNNDEAFGVAVDSSGNVYVCGRDSSSSGTYTWNTLVKYNSSGSLQWQKRLGNSWVDYGYALAIDSSGNVYSVGRQTNTTTGRFEAWVQKYDSDGNLDWQRKIAGSSGVSGFWGVAFDSNDNLYACGSTNSSGAGGSDIFLVKYNSSGGIQWQRTLGGSGTDTGADVAVDSSDNVYITGYTRSSLPSGTGSAAFFVAKYDTDGNDDWKRIIGSSAFDQSHGVSTDSSGNVYITGEIYDGSTSWTAGIVKYDSSGTLQWQRGLSNGTTHATKGKKIKVMGDSFYISGSDDKNPSGTNYEPNALLAKFPTDGSLTGTYGSFTYAASSHTNGNGSLTSSNSSLNESASSATQSNAALTGANSSLTSTKTTVQVGLESNLTAENFIGVSNGAYTNGQTATIQIMGAVDDAQSSLTPGQSYYVQNDGTLSTSAGSPSVFAGTAIAATKLIVRG